MFYLLAPRLKSQKDICNPVLEKRGYIRIPGEDVRCSHQGSHRPEAPASPRPSASAPKPRRLPGDKEGQLSDSPVPAPCSEHTAARDPDPKPRHHGRRAGRTLTDHVPAEEVLPPDAVLAFVFAVHHHDFEISGKAFSA